MKLSCSEFHKTYTQHTKNQALLLDVRNSDEVAHGTLSDSVHIPVSELKERAQELARGKNIFIYCKAGGRAQKAATILNELGFSDVSYATGGGYEDLKKLME